MGNQDWERDEDESVVAVLEDAGSVQNYQRLETVLVIEDQLEMRTALEKRLLAAGLNVVCAHDGVDGLEKIRTVEPDLILLDLNLPRLSGFKLLHALRSCHHVDLAPVIVLTGNSDPEVLDRAARWGIHRVLLKPTKLSRVVEHVLETLKGY